MLRRPSGDVQRAMRTALLDQSMASTVNGAFANVPVGSKQRTDTEEPPQPLTLQFLLVDP